MRILHLNTYDIRGGAARAAYRLHCGLRRASLDSRMLVLHKDGDDPSVTSMLPLLGRLAREYTKAMLRLELVPLHLYSRRQPVPWGLAWAPNPVARLAGQSGADLVHLHWMNHGFMPVASIPRLKQPLVWTFQDLWAVTGGCHYPGDCTRYRQACGACPQLGSTRQHDLSYWTLWRKKRCWRNLDLTIVTPSRWMAECIKSGALFRDARVAVILTGLDTDRYRPLGRRLARQTLSLPTDKKLILFGAVNSTSDPRKGFQYLQPALRRLADEEWAGRAEQAELIVFGASEPPDPPDLGMRAHYQGHLHDDISLALLYSAADVMVVPSVQEAFGQTATEAMACGAPVVAFGATGLLDIVEHRHTGYLAQPYEAGDLARGIAWVLEDDARHAELARRARRRIEDQFTLPRMAGRYIDLYTELLDRASAAKDNDR
ncbi:MAG: glycosyltransferase family 4 protein [Anaerolineae bacterium]|nr:glycosyltransferase family 4 protein [Anaerolineae bacterium]